MLQRIILVLLAAIILVMSGCIGDILNTQRAKDRDLGQMAEDNLKSSPEFVDHIVSFTWDNEPGRYRCVVKDIDDPQRAGRFAYNAMIVLDERNNSIVKSGRDQFLIIGVQSNETIFEVRYGVGFVVPNVTLMGPYEGEEYSPN